MAQDKRLFSIISDLANNNNANAVNTFKAVFEDRLAEKIKNFTSKTRITPNGS